MIAMLDKIALYWQYSFVRYALVVGVLIALCSSLLGVILVLKRFSYIADRLSHIAFGAMSVAAVMNLANDMPLTMGVTILCAVLLLCGGQKAKIKGDAAIAMISIGSLAIGYLLMNIFSSSTNLSGDVCSALFGSTSILTLSQKDVWVCGVLSVVWWCYSHCFITKSLRSHLMNPLQRQWEQKQNGIICLIAVITASIIVLAMNLVGSLLMSALVIFPAVSAMRIFKSFKAVTICSALLSVFCAALGILISILVGTPVGSTIVAVDIVGFVVFSIIGNVRGGVAK